MADIVTWLWFIGGLLLIVIEFFAPHFVGIFLGLAAILVAAVRWMGFVDSFQTSFFLWVASSLFFLITLRRFTKRWLPSESTYDIADEDLEAAGELVEVVDTVSDHPGRIRYRGTTWPAVCKEGTILSGQKAKLLYRDNLVWTVEPHQELDSTNAKETSVDIKNK